MDSIVSSLLSKYLSVFIKNYSSKNLNLSFWSGEGSLTNIEINEDVAGEFLPPFLQADRIFINSLSIKLPFVTNLGYEPIEIIMDTVKARLSEPVNGRPIKTPLKDFLKTLKKPEQKDVKTQSGALYSFTDRILDGITFKMNYLEIQVHTLGTFPSKYFGEWTPPYFQLSCRNFVFKTTDKDWKIVPLKNSLNMNPKWGDDIWVFRAAELKSVNIELKHPSNDDSYQLKNYSAYKPENVRIIDGLSLNMRITQKKTCTGKGVQTTVEIIFDKCHIKLDQPKLKTIIQTMLGFVTASQRKDLIQRKQEFLSKSGSDKMISKGPSSLSTSSKSRTKTDAFKKYINKDVIVEDPEELSDDEDMVVIPTQQEPIGSRTVVKIAMNEFYIELYSAEQKMNDVEIFLVELLGFEFSFIKPEDSDIDKFLQIVVPFFSFAHLHSKFDNDKFKHEETAIIYSNSKEYATKSEKQQMEYTIPIEIWPEFLPTHRFFPDKKMMEYSYRPRDISRRVHFAEGKEMFRLKITLSEDIEIESRVNPIQILMDTRKIIKLTDIIMSSFPDTSLKPPQETIIALPKYVVQKVVKQDKHEEEDEKEFKMVFEIRSPSLLIPSCESTNDEISEFVKLGMREFLISFDPRIKGQDWTEKSLFESKGNVFPTNEQDFTNQYENMWLLLPKKFKIQVKHFLIQLLPSIASPPQNIIEPLNLDFDLGINDETASSFHATLPKLVVMSNLGKIHFHLNQNQAIMLLQIVKSYVDNPPEISFLLINKTTNFAKSTIQNEKDRKEKQQINFEEDKPVDPTLPSMLYFFKLESLVLSLNNSSNSVEDMFDTKRVPVETPICEISMVDSEVLLETRKETKTLLTKSRIAGIHILSPPSEDPHSIVVSRADYPNPYVFKSGKKSVPHMVLLRYEHSLAYAMTKDINKKIFPKLNLKVEGIHVGLNVKAVFQTLKFYHSRDNIFDCSPMEILNRTVKKTFDIIKDKVANSRKVMEKKLENLSNLPPVPIKNVPGSEPIGEDFPKVDPIGEAINLPIKTKDAILDPPLIIETESLDDLIGEDALKELDAGLEDITKQDLLSPEMDEVKKSLEDKFMVQTPTTPFVPEFSQEDTFIQQKPMESLAPPEMSRSESNQSLDNEDEERVSKTKGAERDDDDPPEDESTAEGAYRGDDILLKLKQDTEKLEQLYNSKRNEITPIIFDIEIKDIEIYILGEGKTASAVGVYLSKIELFHKQIDKTWELTFLGKDASLGALIFTQQELQYFSLSQPIAFQGKMLADYVKSVYEKNISFDLFPTSIKIDSSISYVLAKLIKQQFFDLRQFYSLIKFLKQPSKAFRSSFALLNEKIMDSQRSITRAQSSHFALYRIFDEIHRELEEKTVAIQIAIEDKISLMERLAKGQDITVVTPQTQPDKQNSLPISILTEEPKITIHGDIKTLIPGAKEWTSVYCCVIDRKIICLNSKMKPTQANIVKHKYYSLTLVDSSEIYKSLAPVDNDFTPVSVLMIINNEKEKLFLCPSERNRTEEWYQTILKLIRKDTKEEISQKLVMVNAEMQTEYMSYLNDEKHSSTVKEIRNLTKQFERMKKAMRIAKEEEELLAIRMTDLNKYVTQLKEEEVSRMDSIQEKLKKESERSAEFDRYRDENQVLSTLVEDQKRQIAELEKKLIRSTHNVEGAREENNMLKNELGKLIVNLEKKNQALEEKNERYVKQLTTDTSKVGSLEVDQAINNYKTIIADLSQSLVNKDEEIKRLKSQIPHSEHKSLPPLPKPKQSPLPPTPVDSPTPKVVPKQRKDSIVDFLKAGKDFLNKK